jgi:hypothetical protein
VIDALAEERNLHFGGAGVRLVTPEPLHDFLALRLSNSHNFRFSARFLSFSLKEIFITLEPPCKAMLTLRDLRFKVQCSKVQGSELSSEPRNSILEP